MSYLGFTGTRKGLTPPQMEAVVKWFNSTGDVFTGFLHGCAIGADAWMAKFIRNQDRYIPLYAYPCNISDQTSHDAIKISDSVYEAEPPLKRNRTIVDYCNTLLACPADMQEEQRSGTWATIRYARKSGKPIVIVWPDGTLTKE